MSDASKRAGRYFDVAKATARVGAGVAAHKIAGSKDAVVPAALIRAALGGLKGPLMKIGQLLAAIPDFLPQEYADELATLQAHAPSMGWPFVRRRMAAELGGDWQDNFKLFEKNARYAASLGQIHYARDRDGAELACKLQYPDMDQVVEADLRQLKLALGLFERWGGAVSTEEVFREIEERLREELDYEREARNMLLYGRMLAKVDGVRVPQPVKGLSSGRLLCMSWMEGEPFLEAAARKGQADRDRLAMNLFRLWYAPFYRYGVIHGDPHPGNYTVSPDGAINLLDFGCVRVFEPELVQAVILMFESLRDGDCEKAVEAYRLWGFAKPTKQLVEALNIWARFVYAPILVDDVRPIETTNATSQGRAAAAAVYRELKKIGCVSVPRPFVMIDRASVGLGSVFLRLGARVNWFGLFHELTVDFELESLKERQRAALAENFLFTAAHEKG